jgi:imidazolonepropionase-like amidohydrolase
VAAGASLPAAVIEKARSVQAAHDDAMRRAVEAGVTIAMGTDSGVGPHGSNLDELALMASCGMAPDEVWRATTLSAAELLGVAEEFGSLEPGKRADLVVLDGDPQDLTKLESRIREVYQDGELVAADGATVQGR